MKLVNLNPIRDVGSSALFIKIGPFRFLIDSGLNAKKIGYEAIPKIDWIKDYSLDFIILTHAHLDHIGTLPLIFKKQSQATILTSIPTSMLIPRMLLNTYSVMCKQKKEKGIAEYPLFSQKEIIFLKKKIKGIPFEKPIEFFKKKDSVKITFYSSGHIVGASGCMIACGNKKVFLTGDVHFANQHIVAGAQFPKEKIDILIMETTRGAIKRKKSYNRNSEFLRLLKLINTTIKGGGSCLVPIFALGRMQELFSVLHLAWKSGNLINCPIYCSGLGMNLVNYFDTIAKNNHLIKFSKKFIYDLGIKTFKKRIEPGKNIEQPGLFLLSSGMMLPKTPSYKIASSLLNYKNNSICFIGYCDPETPGGKLLKLKKNSFFNFKSLNYSCAVRARIEKFDLSAHADREDLIEYAKSISPKVIILKHGDSMARDWFLNELPTQLPKSIIIDPEPEKNYTL